MLSECIHMEEDDEIVVRPLFENLRDCFTMEFWVKPEGNIQICPETTYGAYGTVGQKYVIGPGHGGGENQAGVGVSVGNNGICVFEHTHNHLPAVLVYETLLIGWNHVAIVYNHKQPSLYLNGDYKKSGLRSPVEHVLASGTFGVLKPYGSFVGDIGEIRFWDHSRSPEQVFAMMNRKLTGREAGLYAHWSFKKESENKLVDLSGNDNHGTIFGSSWSYRSVKQQNKVFVMSHSDYLHSVNGTEKYIFEQQRYLEQKGVEMVQAFPINEKVGINYLGKFLGHYKVEHLLELMADKSRKFVTAYIHHLLRWPEYQYQMLITEFSKQNIKVVFYIHDFFICCPTVFMMYKDEHGERPCTWNLQNHRTGDACTHCHHSALIHSWRCGFRQLLKYACRIIVPSQFVYDIFSAIYPELSRRTMIHGHLRLGQQVEKGVKNYTDGKIKFAFLGQKYLQKGLATWQKIYSNPRLHQIYDFYHVGCSQDYDRVKAFAYSFLEGGTMAATNLLVEQEIDFVLLWSTVPESYSYTLYEAMAAGIPVITSQSAGNISEVVRKEPRLGRVFENEDAMIEFLADYNQVIEL